MNPEPGWSPPSGSSEPLPGVQIEVEPPDGPPPPPFVRQRRRRRLVAWIVAGALVAVGIPVGLAIASFLTEDDGSEVAAGDAEGSEPVPDGEPPLEGTLEPPDLDALDGVDAIFGRLLTDIDASERTMIAFQEDLADTFGSPGDDPGALFQQLSEAAAERGGQLLEVRERLTEELPDAGAEEVRAIYLEHLDSWSEYMGAIEQDPGLLLEETDGSGYTVSINATADAFTRALERELPDDADQEVRSFADGILDRGFRSQGDSQV